MLYLNSSWSTLLCSILTALRPLASTRTSSSSFMASVRRCSPCKAADLRSYVLVSQETPTNLLLSSALPSISLKPPFSAFRRPAVFPYWKRKPGAGGHPLMN